MKPLELALVAPALILSEPAFSQDAGWDLMTKTRNEATYCVVNEAVRLDDHATSPEVIVRGAMRACKRLVVAFDEAHRSKAVEMMPYVPPAQRDPAILKNTEEIHADMQDLAIQAILEGRVTKRATNR